MELLRPLSVQFYFNSFLESGSNSGDGELPKPEGNIPSAGQWLKGEGPNFVEARQLAG